MAHVSDQPVVRGIEHIVQRDREIHYPEPRCQMTAGAGDTVASSGRRSSGSRRRSAGSAMRESSGKRLAAECGGWGVGVGMHGTAMD